MKKVLLSILFLFLALQIVSFAAHQSSLQPSLSLSMGGGGVGGSGETYFASGYFASGYFQ